MIAAELEAFLAAHFGRRHAVVAPRGATALYATLRALATRVGTGDVVMPAIACACLPQVVSYAGFQPVFADVDRRDFNIDVASAAQLVGPKTRAVLAPHMFGHPAPTTELVRLLAGKDVFLIEDAAQSVGGRCGAAIMGSVGDCSLLSFGGGKVISVGGGGAMLTDDDGLADAIRGALAALPAPMAERAFGLKSLSERNLYHAVVDVLRVERNEPVSGAFLAGLPWYEDNYLRTPGLSPSVLAAVQPAVRSLPETNSARLRRAAAYADGLRDADVTLSDAWQESGVLWRYTFVLNDARRTVEVTARLRAAGIDASNHYWSLAELMGGGPELPNAAYLSPRLVNLWVDDTATPERIERACGVVRAAVPA